MVKRSGSLALWLFKMTAKRAYFLQHLHSTKIIIGFVNSLSNPNVLFAAASQ